MRRGDEAHVDVLRLERAHAHHFPLLDDAEELRLQRERQLADLVEEDGAAVGRLEETGLGAIGSGEGAALVAEQLTGQQRLGEGAAIEAHERLLHPRQEAVDHLGDDLLARCPSRR